MQCTPSLSSRGLFLKYYILRAVSLIFWIVLFRLLVGRGLSTACFSPSPMRCHVHVGIGLCMQRSWQAMLVGRAMNCAWGHLPNIVAHILPGWQVRVFTESTLFYNFIFVAFQFLFCNIHHLFHYSVLPADLPLPLLPLPGEDRPPRLARYPRPQPWPWPLVLALPLLLSLCGGGSCWSSLPPRQIELDVWRLTWGVGAGFLYSTRCRTRNRGRCNSWPVPCGNIPRGPGNSPCRCGVCSGLKVSWGFFLAGFSLLPSPTNSSLSSARRYAESGCCLFLSLLCHFDPSFRALAAGLCCHTKIFLIVFF